MCIYPVLVPFRLLWNWMLTWLSPLPVSKCQKAETNFMFTVQVSKRWLLGIYYINRQKVIRKQRSYYSWQSSSFVFAFECLRWYNRWLKCAWNIIRWIFILFFIQLSRTISWLSGKVKWYRFQMDENIDSSDHSCYLVMEQISGMTHAFLKRKLFFSVVSNYSRKSNLLK